MIYFRRVNGSLGQVTYGSIEDDLEMAGSRFEVRADVVEQINTKESTLTQQGMKPKARTPFLVVIDGELE